MMQATKTIQTLLGQFSQGFYAFNYGGNTITLQGTLTPERAAEIIANGYPAPTFGANGFAKSEFELDGFLVRIVLA